MPENCSYKPCSIVHSETPVPRAAIAACWMIETHWSRSEYDWWGVRLQKWEHSVWKRCKNIYWPAITEQLKMYVLKESVRLSQTWSSHASVDNVHNRKKTKEMRSTWIKECWVWHVWCLHLKLPGVCGISAATPMWEWYIKRHQKLWTLSQVNTRQRPSRRSSRVHDGQYSWQVNSVDGLGMIMAAKVAYKYLIDLKPAPVPRFDIAADLQLCITQTKKSLGKEKKLSLIMRIWLSWRTFSTYPQWYNSTTTDSWPGELLEA